MGIFALPESQQTYSNFLGNSLDVIMGVRDCPVTKMTLCVTSDAEKNKCVKMRVSITLKLIFPIIILNISNNEKNLFNKYDSLLLLYFHSVRPLESLRICFANHKLTMILARFMSI